MMINMTYTEMASSVKSKISRPVDFVKNRDYTLPIAPKTDTFTSSDTALTKMNGQNYAASAPTYIKPESAKSLITANKIGSGTLDDKSIDTRFADMMQAILDKQLGVDR